MRKYISFFIAAALILTMFAGIGGTAYAADFDLSVTPSVTEMASGGTVSFEYSVANNTGAPLDGYKIKCNGNPVVETSNQIPSGSHEDSFDMNVTDAMLGVPLTFQLCDSSGTEISGATATVTIAKKVLKVEMGCTVSVSPTKLLDPADVATFSFKIENTGEVALTGIQVIIPELNKGKAINNTAFDRAPGSGPYTVTYQHTFTKTITVNPKITYKVNGAGETKTKTLDPITLTQTIRDVNALLTADKTSPQPGEEVTFTLTITNDGNVPYTDLAVSWNGQDMGFPTSKLNAGGERDKEYKLTFDTSQEVRFTVTLKDHKGLTKEVKSTIVNIQMPVDPNSISANIGFDIEPDRQALTAAGIVSFSGSVFNNSGYTLYDVKVMEATLGEVFLVSEMETGTRLSIPSKTFDINETTAYSFTLSAKDRNGQIYTVNADPITVTIQGATEPSPTDVTEGASDVTLPPANNNGSNPLGVWLIMAGVLVVLIIGVGAALFVVWKKGKMPSRSSSSKAVSRPRAPRQKSPAPKMSMKSKFSPGRSKGYRDRNNF